jgi:hypothetical protein
MTQKLCYSVENVANMPASRYIRHLLIRKCPPARQLALRAPRWRRKAIVN